MSDPWAELRAWAETWAPGLAAGLRPPVAEADVEALSRAFGPLPESMLSVYRHHDGETDHPGAGVLGGARLLSAREILARARALSAAPWAPYGIGVAVCDGDVFVVLREALGERERGELAFWERGRPATLEFRAEGLAQCIEGLGARAARWEICYRPVWGGIEVLDAPRPELAVVGLLAERVRLEVELAQELMDMAGLCAVEFAAAAPIGWPGLGTFIRDGDGLRLERRDGPTGWIDETAAAFGSDRDHLRLAVAMLGDHAARALAGGRSFDLPRVGAVHPDGDGVRVALTEKAAATLRA